MSKGIIDVLPSYEDEVLVSWIVRMLRHYSVEKLGEYTSIIMKELFGPNSSDRPGLYFQKGLNYFIENSDVKDGNVFSSEAVMLKHMSHF